MIIGHHNECRREQDEVVCLVCSRRFSINDEVYPPCKPVVVHTAAEVTVEKPAIRLTKEICDQMLLHGQVAGYYELTTDSGRVSFCLFPIDAQLFELRNKGGVVKWVCV